MKVALYARVSKAGDQTPENQLIELRRWAAAGGHEIAGEFVDECSSRDTRPQKEEVLRLLRVGQIKGVAFVALDRWGRSLSELVREFEEAVERKWVMVSLKEGISFDTAAGRLYAHMLGAFAAFERDIIRERTIAGLARVRAQGKRLGRPCGGPRCETCGHSLNQHGCYTMAKEREARARWCRSCGKMCRETPPA